MAVESLERRVSGTEIHGFKRNLVNPLATPGNASGQLNKISKVAMLDDRGEPVKNEQYLDLYGRRIASKHIRPKSIPVGTAVTTRGSKTIIPAVGECRR